VPRGVVVEAPLAVNGVVVGDATVDDVAVDVAERLPLGSNEAANWTGSLRKTPGELVFVQSHPLKPQQQN